MPDFKLLALNVISAQDLPPVSKTLRTFATVFVDPSHKLTTRVDHQGRTNPTWNYKVAFQVDEKFLQSESSVVVIEIYNVSWLRDLPIGTAHLFINNLSPALRGRSSERRVKLQVRGASGHLQGTLNLGVQLVDYTIPGQNETNISRSVNDPDEENREADEEQEEKERDSGPEESKIEGLISNQERRVVSRAQSEPETENYTTYTYSNSLFSAMRPLPSEVAEGMKKWLYSSEGDDFGSSIFENWSETGGKSETHLAKSENFKFANADDVIQLKNGKNSSGYSTRKRSYKKRLLSCIGNAYGFQFSFICGSKKLKREERKKKQDFQLVGLPEENLRRLYG